MTAPRAAAITGLGLHGAFGGAEETWRALEEGRSALTSWKLPGVAGLPELPAAPAARVSLGGLLRDRKLQKYMNPAAELAVAAAGRALADAGALHDADFAARLALFVATDLIAFDLAEVTPALRASVRDGRLDYALLGERGLKTCHPLLPFKMLLNMPLGLSSIAYGARGENFVAYPGPEQAGVCLEAALRGLRADRFSCALTGASAQRLGLVPMTTALRQDRLPRSAPEADPVRPECKALAPADSGAFLVIESAEAAARRGAPARARLHEVVAAHAAPDEVLPELWGEACPEKPPDLVLLTGFDGRAAAQAARAARGRWPAARAASFDGRLGFAGAASIVTALVLGVEALRHGRLPDGVELVPLAGGAAVPSSALVTCRDPEGGLVVARLSNPEGAR